MTDDMPSQDMADSENIKPGKPKERRKTPKRITEKYLHNSGLAYLQRFPTSTGHFRRIMGRKIDRSCKHHVDQSRADCLALLEKTVETFQRMGLLNDELYLSGMVNSLRRRGLSAQAIAAKLAAKGFPHSITAEALYQAAGGKSQEADLAAGLLFARRKRLGPFSRSNAPDIQRDLAALGRAGYSYDVAQQILRIPLEEAEATLYRLT